MIGYTAFSVPYDDKYPNPLGKKRSLGPGKLVDKRGLEECPATITAYAAGGTSNFQDGLTACAVVAEVSPAFVRIDVNSEILSRGALTL